MDYSDIKNDVSLGLTWSVVVPSRPWVEVKCSSSRVPKEKSEAIFTFKILKEVSFPSNEHIFFLQKTDIFIICCFFGVICNLASFAVAPPNMNVVSTPPLVPASILCCNLSAPLHLSTLSLLAWQNRWLATATVTLEQCAVTAIFAW